MLGPVVALVLAGALGAAPWRPTDPARVLERLPAPDPALARARAAWRARLATRPDDLEAALALARSFVEEGRTRADPRAFGYAQAALAPWWEAPEPPVPVRVLRAAIHQAAHRFEPARADLEAALARDPGAAQARLSLAVLLQVLGRPKESARVCAGLLMRTSELVTCACLAPAGALSGTAAASYDLLAGALARAPDAPATERLWAEGLLGEMAARLGRTAAAEAHFEAALAGGRDVYLLGAYADLLLDTGRAGEVEALLGAEGRSADPLLLRLAEAAKAGGRPGATALIQALERRFAALAARGDRVHLREEARFALRLAGQPARALELALANWELQREPADARLVLEAALAAGRPAAAEPVLAWIRELGLEDVALAGLAARLAAGRP